MNIDWNNQVEKDFRRRILVDADNPILAFKANRDRFCGSRVPEEYVGLPHLGSVNSEDALTWNVFRFLQKEQRLDMAFQWLGLDIGRPTALLIWCLAPELTDAARELQFKLGDLIRRSDGMLRGQIGEPDVVILGTEGIAVIECKLGEPKKAPSYLWEGSSVERIEKRLHRYRRNISELDNVRAEDIMPIYQLVRMAYYAIMLGRIYKLPTAVVSVGNDSKWSVEIRKRGKSADQLWNEFCNLASQLKILTSKTMWQALTPIIDNKGVGALYPYLSQHPCLQ